MYEKKNQNSQSLSKNILLPRFAPRSLCQSLTRSVYSRERDGGFTHFSYKSPLIFQVMGSISLQIADKYINGRNSPVIFWKLSLLFLRCRGKFPHQIQMLQVSNFNFRRDALLMHHTSINLSLQDRQDFGGEKQTTLSIHQLIEAW